MYLFYPYLRKPNAKALIISFSASVFPICVIGPFWIIRFPPTLFLNCKYFWSESIFDKSIGVSWVLFVYIHAIVFLRISKIRITFKNTPIVHFINVLIVTHILSKISGINQFLDCFSSITNIWVCCLVFRYNHIYSTH